MKLGHFWGDNMRLKHLCRSIVLTVLLITLAVTPFQTRASPPADLGDPYVPYDEVGDFGGGPIDPPMDLTTEAEMAAIYTEVAANIAALTAEGGLAAANAEAAVSFGWPLRRAEGFTDYGYHGVSGFVDHNPASNALLDYMCGRRTYDLSSGYDHGGTDFFTYPFPWYKMDHAQVEIVAAAPGTLVFKRDGQYDRNCAMTGALSNAVVLRHADGTLTHYLHMKKGSVTPKAVGATIAQGEYLGVVGSSGSSTGPHLHFEVRTADNAHVIDPFEGPCNAVSSLWAEQPSYYDSAVTKVHTGSDVPRRPPCPQQEVPNIQDVFEPEDTVTFVTTYRDQRAGQTSTYRILRPDGSVYRTWTHASTAAHYTASYWYWKKDLDWDGQPPRGTWRFEVDFEGHTYGSNFFVGGSTAITITHPNGGEALLPGTILPIVWNDTLDCDVSIDLYKGGELARQVVATTPSDGVYFWAAPADLAFGTDYTVRIADAATKSLYDSSDACFTIAPVPVATFTLTPSLGPSPLTVAFTDTSTSLVDSWLWTFGDGATNTVQHPIHRYKTPGIYTVTLAVGGPTGSGVLTVTDAVTVEVPPLTAEFSARPLWGAPPITVTFNDRSVGPPIDRWSWDFGDGTTSTLQSPTHVFTDYGPYTVTLTVGSAEEEHQRAKATFIVGTDMPWRIFVPVSVRW